MNGIEIGFGVGIKYPSNTILGIIGEQEEDNIWLFNDNSEILWSDGTNILTNEE